MNNFTEWIQYFLNETENNLSSDKQISIIKTTLNLFNANKTEDKPSIDLVKNEEENKPTQIVYYPNGNISYKSWFINNKHHNENGPAYIKYDKNGNVKYKAWWINDKCHNDNGPAVIRYDEDGNIIRQEYWENGTRIK